MAALGLVGYASALVALHPRPAEWSGVLSGDGWAWLQEDPQRALIMACGGVGWLLAAWLFTVTTLTVVGNGAGATSRMARRLAEVIAPVALRGILEVALGAALAGVPLTSNVMQHQHSHPTACAGCPAFPRRACLRADPRVAPG